MAAPDIAPPNPLFKSLDLDLVHRAKEGDVASFSELVSRHERKVFRLTQHIIGNREDAEDALQEAFLKAYTKLDQFQEGAQFSTWLVRIAVNESLMKLRKRRHTPFTISLDEPIESDDGLIPREIGQWEDNPESKFAQQEVREILDQELKSMPEAFRTVLVLRDLEQISTEETARLLEISIPAVKSRLLRARLHLREKLNKYFERGKSA
ncbi:MAG: sigma-70 family RNA polymerase sigma factor [Acidobacteria bacterium]|nr:sigma-70 family RNA polymerase sigma factor [Acidobacteriota bacterium]